jgi:hypothetical protein
VLQGQLRGPGAFPHGRTGAEGSFMTLRERRVQQNVVRNQELWQLGEDGVVRRIPAVSRELSQRGSSRRAYV